jgi:ATP-dependent RNA helicase DDX56/DBP9
LTRKILVAERGDADEDDEEQQGGTCSSVGGVILVPTRELCDQVSRVLDDLSYYCADVVKVVTLSSSTPSGGGRNGSSAASSNKARKEMLRQEALLRDRPDVIVATPAGLVTHVRSGALNLKRTVETLVVDEADLILSFGEFVTSGR